MSSMPVRRHWVGHVKDVETATCFRVKPKLRRLSASNVGADCRFASELLTSVTLHTITLVIWLFTATE